MSKRNEVLDMGNLTDDDSEALLCFAHQVADMKLYGSETDFDGDDALEAMNGLIEEARNITNRKANK